MVYQDIWSLLLEIDQGPFAWTLSIKPRIIVLPMSSPIMCSCFQLQNYHALFLFLLFSPTNYIFVLNLMIISISFFSVFCLDLKVSRNAKCYVCIFKKIVLNSSMCCEKFYMYGKFDAESYFLAMLVPLFFFTLFFCYDSCLIRKKLFSNPQTIVCLGFL